MLSRISLSLSLSLSRSLFLSPPAPLPHHSLPSLSGKCSPFCPSPQLSPPPCSFHPGSDSPPPSPPTLWRQHRSRRRRFLRRMASKQQPRLPRSNKGCGMPRQNINERQQTNPLTDPSIDLMTPVLQTPNQATRIEHQTPNHATRIEHFKPMPFPHQPSLPFPPFRPFFSLHFHPRACGEATRARNPPPSPLPPPPPASPSAARSLSLSPFLPHSTLSPLPLHPFPPTPPISVPPLSKPPCLPFPSPRPCLPLWHRTARPGEGPGGARRADGRAGRACAMSLTQAGERGPIQVVGWSNGGRRQKS